MKINFIYLFILFCFVRGQDYGPGTGGIILPGFKERVEISANYNTDEFHYAHPKAPIEIEISYNDLYKYYIKGDNDSLVGLWLSKDFGIEVAIIKYPHSFQEMKYQYLMLVTKSDHKRFEYFEVFGRISHKERNNLFSGIIQQLYNKVFLLSPDNAVDTVLAKYGQKKYYGDAAIVKKYGAKTFSDKMKIISDFMLERPYPKSYYYLSQNKLKVEYSKPAEFKKWKKYERAETFEAIEKISLNFNRVGNKTPSNQKEFNIGSGFLLNKNIVGTAYHVIEGNHNLFIVNSNNDTLKGEVITKDKFNDLVLIKTKNILDSDLPIPYTVDSKLKPKTGSSIYTIGYPFGDIMGSESRVSEGIINSLYGLDDDPRLIQISNPIQPGNSGGILIDKLNGNLIGVVVSGLSSSYFLKELGTVPQNVNFSIKSNYLKVLIESTDIDLEKINEINLLEGKSLDEQFKIIKPFVVKVLAN